jgi:hypothetical protein
LVVLYHRSPTNGLAGGELEVVDLTPPATMLVALICPPTPNPPVITTAPVAVDVLVVVLVNETTLVVVAPRLVIDCNVLVFHITMLPVLVLIAVSVPAVILV